MKIRFVFFVFVIFLALSLFHLRVFAESSRGVNTQRTFHSSTPLIDAMRPSAIRTRRESFLEAQKLIEAGIDVNIQDDQGWTALMFACYTDDHESINLLLNSGADVNKSNQCGKTALMILLDHYGDNSFETMQTLLKHGADVCAVDHYGETALSIASPLSSPKIIDFLIRREQAECVASSSARALWRATRNRNLESVETLLKHKDKSSISREDMSVALTEVCSRSGQMQASYQIALALIDHGAEVNFVNENGVTPLGEAAENHHLDIARLLLDNQAQVNKKDKHGRTPLTRAARSSDYTAVIMAGLLVAHGADVNAGEEGWTPLPTAVFHNNLELVRFLTGQGVSQDQKRLAFFSAVHRGFMDIIDFLHKAGVNIDDRDHWGRTALMHAVKDGNDLLVKSLLAKGADVNLLQNKPRAGMMDFLWSPLGLAARYDRHQIVMILLDAGADAFMKNLALVEAVLAGHGDMVQLLIVHGADVNAQTNLGTPLERAQFEKRDDIIQILINAGAKK